ncbi:MAG TPA: TlpA disulfide reductase family protein [Caulobacteraceae bacterium]|nr:TlpA disulfide reductase family protein [Caulobacteraceae bacterium]
MSLDRRSLLGAIPAGFLGDLFRAPVVGKPAPPFTLRTFDGRKFALADLTGKVVLLNYWAIWCTPCRIELPMFNVYVQTHRHPDLMVFAVDTDDDLPESKLKQLSGMVAFPLVRSLAGPYGAIHNELPSNYVIDRAGILRYAQGGAFTEDALDAMVTPLLAEPAPTRPVST